MRKVSAKRQITIPKNLCNLAGIQPGDFVELFEYEGHITIIKKEFGCSTGAAKHLLVNADANVSDENSLQDAFVET